MIKRIFLYIAIMVSLAACSDDIFDAPVDEVPSDGRLSIAFKVPEMKQVGTRAEAVDENGLHTITMLVFDGENGNLCQTEEWSYNGGTQTVTINEELRKNPNLRFLFVANSPIAKEGFTLGQSFDAIKDILTEHIIYGNCMVMSGTSTLQELLGMETVYLIRNGAKVTVKSDAKPAVPYFFKVFGTATESSILSGTEGLTSIPYSKYTLPAKIDESEIEETIYLHPTKNTESHLTKSYIIVKADFNGTGYYYRLDFQKEKDGVLDILPNHYYEVTILGEPAAAGYPTPTEAAKNPTPLSAKWYTIDDHSPVIFNMVSDGTHELGVSHLVYNPNSAGNSEADLYVKVFSVDNPEEEAEFAKDYRNLISFEEEWLELGAIEEVAKNGDTGNDLSEEDLKNGGTVYRIPVIFKNNGDLSEAKTSGKVVWKGLSREFMVEWNREFDPSALLNSVKLTVKEGNTVQWGLDKTDYFPFLRGVDGNQGKVWGVSAEDNNGLTRDQGLHFPLMYGESTRWTYEYELEFNDLGQGSEYSWEAEMTGDGAVTCVNISSGSAQKLKGAGPKLTLSRSGDGWDYGTGALEITVRQGNKISSYSVPVYHTGFFHKDSTTGLYGSLDTSRPYTYYEVVSMGDRHWLDRNLGAHSAGLYIEDSDGTAYHGDSGAAGGYYRVADYNQHASPTMKSGICPPGYDYPTTDDFDQVRKSSSFSTAQSGSYNTASYKVSESKTVYFPKARYLNSSNVKMGEARSGYYWTQSPASGTEKEEIGAWLKSLAITGNATSYINGEVNTKNFGGYFTTHQKSAGYAMNVRCVNKQSRDDKYFKTNFFVMGATHVYLYTIIDGRKVAVNSWPGQPIGTYNTVSSNYQDFNFESTVYAPNQLYVIFNYRKQNGQIVTYSANPSDHKKFEKTTSVMPNQLTGWKVIDDETPKKGLLSKLGGYWTIDTNTNEVIYSSVDPTTPEDGVYYKLEGIPFGGWGSPKDMKYNNGVWTWTGTPTTGEFGIKKCDQSGSQIGWVWSITGETISGNGTYKCVVQNSSKNNGRNWTNNITSKATFTFDPEAMTLTVSGAEEPPYYVFMWATSYGCPRLHLWDSGNTYINRQSDAGIGKQSGNYYYICITANDLKAVPAIGNGWQFNFCEGYNDWNNTERPFNSTYVEESNNGVPDNIKYQYGVSGDPLKVFLLKL